MKKFLLVFFIFLFSCSNSKPYILSNDSFSYDLNNNIIESLHHEGFYFEIPEVMEKNKEYYIEDIMFEDKNVGNLKIYNDKVVYLDLYLKQFNNNLTLNGYTFDNSIKNACDYFRGKLKDNENYYCEIKNKNISMIIHGDITELNKDELNRIEILIK